MDSHDHHSGLGLGLSSAGGQSLVQIHAFKRAHILNSILPLQPGRIPYVSRYRTAIQDGKQSLFAPVASRKARKDLRNARVQDGLTPAAETDGGDDVPTSSTEQPLRSDDEAANSSLCFPSDPSKRPHQPLLPSLDCPSRLFPFPNHIHKPFVRHHQLTRSCIQVNIPKTRRTYCKGKDCKKHTQHKVTQYKAGKVHPPPPLSGPLSSTRSPFPLSSPNPR